jgi:hypothetical protein
LDGCGCGQIQSAGLTGKDAHEPCGVSRELFDALVRVQAGRLRHHREFESPYYNGNRTNCTEGWVADGEADDRAKSTQANGDDHEGFSR